MSSGKNIIMVKVMTDRGPAMIPYSQLDREKVDALPFDKALKHQVTQLRSVPHNNLYWAVLRLVVDNNPIFILPERLHKLLLTACGVVEPFVDLDGNMSLIPSSAAFEAMKKDDFDVYFEAALQVICEKIMPGMDPKHLVLEAKRRCGWRDAA